MCVCVCVWFGALLGCLLCTCCFMLILEEAGWRSVVCTCIEGDVICNGPLFLWEFIPQSAWASKKALSPPAEMNFSLWQWSGIVN